MGTVELADSPADPGCTAPCMGGGRGGADIDAHPYCPLSCSAAGSGHCFVLCPAPTWRLHGLSQLPYMLSTLSIDRTLAGNAYSSGSPPQRQRQGGGTRCCCASLSAASVSSVGFGCRILPRTHSRIPVQGLQVQGWVVNMTWTLSADMKGNYGGHPYDGYGCGFGYGR